MTPGEMRRRGGRRPIVSLHPTVEGLEVRALLSVGSSTSAKGADSAGDDGDPSVPKIPGFKAIGLDVAAPAGNDAELTVAAYYTAGDVGVGSAKIDWGDGTDPTKGTINDLGLANPVFGAGTISGDHTYAKPGTYKILVTIAESGADGDGKTFSVTSKATVTDPTPVPGPAMTLTEAAGFEFMHDRLATFTVGLPGATADSFKAKIDWGDNTNASAGEVVAAPWQPYVLPPGWGEILADAAGSLGLKDVPPLGDPATLDPLPTRFNIKGDHTYAEPGTYVIHITITDANGNSVVAKASVNVVAGPLVATAAYGPLSTVAGAALPDYTSLATFTDFRFNDGVAPDSASYTVKIDWGDGTDATSGKVEPLVYYWLAAETGVKSAIAGFVPEDLPTHPSFNVTGSHSYAKPGTYKISLTIADEKGDTVATADTAEVVASVLKAQGVPVSAFPGQAFEDLPVASFRDAAGPLPADAYTAKIDWGDGSDPTSGEIGGPYWIYAGGPIGIKDPPDPGGFLQVMGSHTYAKAGKYTITVTIDGPGDSSATATTTATVAGILAQGLDVAATTKVDLQPLSVASFQVPGADASASDFTATIEWGDGTTSAGTISQPGWFTVGAPTPKVSADGGWGDENPLSWFTVQGSHAYAQAGKYTIAVTITATSGQTGTTSSTATVNDEVLKATAAGITATAGKSTGGVAVAKFTDSVLGADPGRFKATIDWGDGTTTDGTIVGDFLPYPVPLGGDPAGKGSDSAGNALPVPLPIIWPMSSYRVMGKHSYAEPGTFRIRVTITKLDGDTVSVDGKAGVSAPPTPGKASGVPGTPVVAGTVTTLRKLATFSTNAPVKPSDFKVTIRWGDGSPASGGKLQLAPGSSHSSSSGKAAPTSAKGTQFVVLGTHKFRKAGTYLVRITITGKNGAVTTTTAKVVVIAAPKSHPSSSGKR